MSDKKISDEVITQAAEILLKGAKMLSFHCPDCKMPLFEKDSKIFCVSCKKNFEIVEVEGKKILKEKEEKKEEEQFEKVKIKEKIDFTVISAVEKAVTRVAELIASSNNAEEIYKLTESLEKVATTLEKVKKLYT
ncbi:MAG: hypothetical protein NZ895_04570 [Archaeoglobaceae archaeon]|nr:hypothetical protein [Archaeoglobaceae archaeon]MCX8152612.1 hypothetical protein [Archaeoglobaceae archaeon]MDW8014106.1 Sjogren's syndrome/scleroderma autoantigen 1 family protein [Archaeoglobaceae archaeon]